MDLTYQPSLAASLEGLDRTLAAMSVEDETAACTAEAKLWAEDDRGDAAPAASPLAQFAEFRAMGAYAVPLANLLARVGRSYVPLPPTGTRGAIALGWPDATAPWQPGEALTADVTAENTLAGIVNVAPFCVPAGRLAFLAQAGADVALIECGPARTRLQRVGDGFAVTIDGAPAICLARGDAALQAWEWAAFWERLALVGLTVGLIDRAWRIALDAICEGQRQGSFVANEQVAQFQLSDNYIDRLAAERLAQDVAIDAERGRAVDEKLALARCYTAGQAERCAARALHLASLFLPRLVPIARWFTQRAHHLSVFGAAREHEVRTATAGLAAGMRLD